MWCVSVSCMCLCGPRCPYVCSGFYEQGCVAGAPCPTIPSAGFVSGSPSHTLPCVCGPRAFVRVCSPCAFEVCVHLGSSVCPLAPPCPRVPCAEAGSCVLESRGHPRLHPGAPGGRPRGTHGRGWTHRPAGAGRWEGAVAAGSAGTSPRQTGGRVGGGGRGFEPAPEPRGPLPLPAAWGAPAQPRSRQNAISRAGASRLGGLFRAGFGQKRGKQGGGPKTR